MAVRCVWREAHLSIYLFCCNSRTFWLGRRLSRCFHMTAITGAAHFSRISYWSTSDCHFYRRSQWSKALKSFAPSTSEQGTKMSLTFASCVYLHHRCLRNGSKSIFIENCGYHNLNVVTSRHNVVFLIATKSLTFLLKRASFSETLSTNTMHALTAIQTLY